MELHIKTQKGKQTFSCSEECFIMDALHNANIALDAPCGGNGTCGKCKVLVNTHGNVRYELACRTKVEDGMEVSIEASHPMEVSTKGLTRSWTADTDKPGYGLAFDIGTTTLVCRVVELSSGKTLANIGRANPQISYGADVISRISACTDGHLSNMTTLLSEALQDMTEKALRSAHVKHEEVRALALAGNTIMEHIAAGISPEPIGVMPFVPPTLFGENRSYLPNLPECYFADCIAGYVGGDISCGMLALDMIHAEEPVFLLDLGTNGEMALGNKDSIVSCATAAGPVFEGANIEFGMPAYPGAISKVSYNEGTSCLELNIIGNTDATGICGTGLIDAVAFMLETGIVDETGLIVDADEVPDHLEAFIIEYNDEPAFKLTESICVTQSDVRNLQLAKAAVCAGMLTLLDDANLSTTDIDKLYIAGGFGEYLNLENAATVGIFPSALLPCALSVGNTAIEGASELLCCSQASIDMKEIVKKCSYLELSMHKGFNAHYIETIAFEEDF